MDGALDGVSQDFLLPGKLNLVLTRTLLLRSNPTTQTMQKVRPNHGRESDGTKYASDR
jgi:hypothetical protein